MKIYVGGSSAEMPRAKGWMNLLRIAGHTVTSTWVENIEKVAELKKLEPHLAANPMDAPREARAEWSRVDLDELTSADLLWMLLPSPGMKVSAGAYCELGYALMYAVVRNEARTMIGGSPSPVPEYAIMCSGVEQSIFTALVRHYDEDQLAFDAINRAQKIYDDVVARTPSR